MITAKTNVRLTVEAPASACWEKETRRITAVHSFSYGYKTMLGEITCSTMKHCLPYMLNVCARCVSGFIEVLCDYGTYHCAQVDLFNIKRKSIGCQFCDSISCSALYTHYLQCAHFSHGWTNLRGSRGSSSVLMTTFHWPLQRKQMEPQGDVSISLTTWVS